MPPMAYSVSDVLKMVGIGRTKFYQLVTAGDIKTRKIGTRTIVLASDLEAWVQSLPTSREDEAND